MDLKKQLNQRIQRHTDGTVERWRDVPGWEGLYRVSDRGRVKSVPHIIPHWRGGTIPRKGKILIPHLGTYASVSLSKRGKVKTISIQYIVLWAFIGPKPTPNYKALHFDDNPHNNQLGNLRWGTQKENGQDAIRNGRNLPGEKNGHSKLTDKQVLEIRQLYPSRRWTLREMGEKYGVGWLAIFNILHRKTWKHI